MCDNGYKYCLVQTDEDYMLINEKELKIHFDGDEELIGELLEVFQSSYPETFAAMKVSLHGRIFKDLELHAHTLKGMVSNFFAKDLKDAAFEFEKMGRQGKITISDSDERKLIDILETGLPKMIEDVRSIL